MHKSREKRLTDLGVLRPTSLNSLPISFHLSPSDNLRVGSRILKINPRHLDIFHTNTPESGFILVEDFGDKMRQKPVPWGRTGSPDWGWALLFPAAAEDGFAHVHPFLGLNSGPWPLHPASPPLSNAGHGGCWTQAASGRKMLLVRCRLQPG